MTLTPNPVTRPFDGMTQLLWRYGNAVGGLNSGNAADASISNGLRNVIVSSAIPTNPINNLYIPVVNASGYPSVVVVGMRTPSVTLQACLKPFIVGSPNKGWCNAGLLNSLISVGTDQQTDRFAIRFTDDTSTPRIWDWSRCDTIRITGDASGGPIMVTLGFKCRFGNAESENPYALTFISGNQPGTSPSGSFTTPVSDAGTLPGNSDWDFNNTLSDVSSFSLTLMRGQRWRARAGVVSNAVSTGRVMYANDIDSGQFSGVLTVVQDAGASTIVAGAGTIQLRLNTSYTGANGGILITCTINEDNYVYPVESAFGTLTTTYSLINLASGGNPAVITALP